MPNNILNDLDFGYPTNVSPTRTPLNLNTGAQPNNAWAQFGQRWGMPNAPLNPDPSTGGNTGGQRNWRDFWWGSTDAETGVQTPGALSTGLAIAQGGVNAYLAMRNYGMAKRTLRENRRQFDLNYENQRKLVNAELSDRQRRRNIENPDSVPHDEYMRQWGL